MGLKGKFELGIEFYIILQLLVILLTIFLTSGTNASVNWRREAQYQISIFISERK